MFKVVFQHIPKCAGTSVHQAFLEHFNDKSICPERFNKLESYSYEEINSYEFFSGHFDAWRTGLIPGPKFTFTFLREPIDRVISLYNFWRSHTWEHINENNLIGPSIAKSSTFEEFLKSQHIAVKSDINNVFVRTALGPIRSEKIEKIILNKPEMACEMAIKYYESLNFVGNVSDIKLQLPELFSKLNLELKSVPFANKGANTTSKIREEIDDFVLTDEAKTLLDKNLINLDQIVFNSLITEKST